MCLIVSIAATATASALQIVYILYKVYYSGFVVGSVFLCSLFSSESLLHVPRNCSAYTVYAQHGLDGVGGMETRYRLDCLGFQLRWAQEIFFPHPSSRGELSYLAPLGSENISAPYFKQCFFFWGGGYYPPDSQTPRLPVPRQK